ncbi:sensor histidine kinase [Pedobacter nutrimenti]|uniref:GHKL domain-containing protein n=1 Tax=Pedobacter nutrimenti TaxID=1241337 RepID=A0A318UGA2_9SPHI|nr:histidine kinase [Pedobacter nutrimenti]PYF74397.1 GHKL domain-containing protein [Pedobacter nutrimenti]
MRKKAIIYLHIGYWTLVYIQVLLVGVGTGVLGTYFDWKLFTGIVMPVKFLQMACSILFFYMNYLLLIPFFLKKGNIFKYLSALIAVILILTPLYYVTEQHVYPLLGWKSYELDLDFSSALMVTISSCFIHIFLGLLLSYLMDWRTIRTEKELAEKEQLKTELAFLKSQINPHFLFNTINDIYALSQQQSEQAPGALLKLSELLRYMLRESDGTYVPLAKEIAYLENVIELQKIGQKGFSYVNFRVDGEPAGQMIAPLILINFLENAFKHGVFTQEQEPIEILVHIDKNAMYFHIENKINTFKKDKTGGIGLANVKRRLALIYPKKHELLIEEKKATFIVDLKINLT